MLLPPPYLAQTIPAQFAELHLHVRIQKQVQKLTLVDLMVQFVCAGTDASSVDIVKAGSIDNLTLLLEVPWAARYNTWLLNELTPKGVVLSFINGGLKPIK